MSENVEPLSDAESIQLTNLLIAMKGPLAVSCEYRNWRDETSVRHIRPIAFWSGSTEWHPAPGLFLTSFDLDKGAERDFRVEDFNIATLTTYRNGE